jgi:hypothetical protein
MPEKFVQKFLPFFPKAKTKLKLAGLLARPVFCAFPPRLDGTVALIQKPFKWAYSCGYSSGISPDSLFDLPLRKRWSKT